MIDFYQIRSPLSQITEGRMRQYISSLQNALGEELDTQTISDEWNEKGNTSKKEDLEDAVKLSYSELHASVAEDGKITLSIENKMHPEKSGIEW